MIGERITFLETAAFRGVREFLEVDLDGGTSLAIFGENGTGKSTIADAIEWYFSGKIEVLQKEGRYHALRHLDAPVNIKTRVRVSTTGALGGEIRLDDRVFNEAHLARVREIAATETYLLRGRTLSEFVEKSKGEKWKSLVDILGLADVDQLRLDLQSVRNSLRLEARSAKESLDAATISLRDRVANVDPDGLLAEIKRRCEAVSIVPPADLEAVFNGDWWISTIQDQDPALNDLGIQEVAFEAKQLSKIIINSSPLVEWNASVTASSGSIRAELHFLEAASSLLTSRPGRQTCPLCEQPIEHETLTQRIRTLLEGMAEASAEHERAAAALQEVRGQVFDVARRVADLYGMATSLGLMIPDFPIGPAEIMDDTVGDRNLGADASAVADYQTAVRSWSREILDRTRDVISTLSESKQEPLVELGALAADAKRWSQLDVEHQLAFHRAKVADEVFSNYQRKERQLFTSTLELISDQVGAIYERLHPDENLRAVSMEPWSEKGAELAVDFHGSRQKPPQGVLSESHLNSLAIALFLAMASTFNQRLGFLVLDDVVNSFDVEHRGHLAEMLVSDFGQWQLIVLTHDSQFFERVHRLGQRWSTMEFTSWSFEEGPRTKQYGAGRLRERAEQLIDEGDLQAACGKARRGLEEVLLEVCEGLEAPLPFRRGARNDIRDATDLMKGVRRYLKEHAKPVLAELQPLLVVLEADLQATLNPAIHAGRGRISALETRDVIKHVEEFDPFWTCRECKTRVWSKGILGAHRCKCGQSQLPPPVEV